MTPCPTRKTSRPWRRCAAHIKHVIYIVKENRTYDQVLGDLDRGNGDPSLAEFGQVVTPNQHRLADQFVDLDNMLCSGEVSGNGWPWSTAARETDFNVKTVPLGYAGRGSPRADSAADGPDGEKQQGYIWDSALRHNLTIRNYGFETRIPARTPVVPDPFATPHRVEVPVWPHLADVTDPYFRGFDNKYPDFRREWSGSGNSISMSPKATCPILNSSASCTIMRAISNAPSMASTRRKKQTADNDYAVGKLIERVAHSPYASSTLIFVIEDDAQNGPDHVTRIAPSPSSPGLMSSREASSMSATPPSTWCAPSKMCSGLVISISTTHTSGP